MSTTPNWMPYAALGMSAGALAVAILALLLNFLSYRTGRHLIRVRAKFDRSTETLHILVFNKGRSDVEIERLELRCPANTTFKTINLTSHLKKGPSLKHAQLPGTSSRWEVKIAEAIDEDNDRGVWFMPAQAHMMMSFARPVAPRVMATLATRERCQSPFIRGLGRMRFKKIYYRIFWSRFPNGNPHPFQGPIGW